MTDIEVLFLYRLKQAEETLLDSEKMLKAGVSPKSITNRAYYSMFYSLLALFLRYGVEIKTSKHIGVISVFDKEFVQAKKIDKYYSEILHKMFNARQKGDYKDLIVVTIADAESHVKMASEFVMEIKKLIEKV